VSVCVCVFVCVLVAEAILATFVKVGH
jgi:hypothetical protein